MKKPFALQYNRMLALLVTAFFVQFTGYGQTVYNSASQTAYSNVAQGKPAAASSSDDAAHAAMYAFDGNRDTRFSSGYTDDQWLSVDMGKAYFLNTVILVWEKSYGKDFDILFSNNGSFTDLYIDSVHIRNRVLSNNSIAGTDTIRLKPNTIARYARIQGVHRATAKGYSMWEMQVMGTTSLANLFPVSVTDFNATSGVGTSLLEWTNITEYSNAGFSVERSNDAINFTPIGWVAARNAGTVVSHYNFTDKQALPGKNYYRLKQTWLDGKTAYSAVITVLVTGNTSVNTYPVPAKDRLVIEYKGTAGESISVDLFNSFGLPVYNSKLVVQSAHQLITIARTANMTPGQYYLTISAGNTKKYSGKIILQ
ncbi:MAG: discoidin domain-containing protein [Chitinophagaceae bacterium]